MLLEAPGVYLITCVANGRIYIGSSASLLRRWYYHRRDLRNGSHVSRHMQAAWNKHGEQSFIIEAIEYSQSRDDAISREAYWLKQLQPFGDHGFNGARDPSRTTLGYKYTDEQRAAISSPVAEYDNAGRLVARYTSRSSAALAKGLRGPELISRAVASGWRRAGGAYWRDDNGSTPEHIEVPVPPPNNRHRGAEAAGNANRKPMIQMTLDGADVRVWPSCVAAAKALGKPRTWLAKAARIDRAAYGYKWRYLEAA